MVHVYDMAQSFLALNPMYRKFGMLCWIFVTGCFLMKMRSLLALAKSMSFPIAPLPGSFKRMRLLWDIALGPKSRRSLRLVLRTERCECMAFPDIRKQHKIDDYRACSSFILRIGDAICDSAFDRPEKNERFSSLCLVEERETRW